MHVLVFYVSWGGKKSKPAHSTFLHWEKPFFSIFNSIFHLADSCSRSIISYFTNLLNVLQHTPMNYRSSMLLFFSKCCRFLFKVKFQLLRGTLNSWHQCNFYLFQAQEVLFQIKSNVKSLHSFFTLVRFLFFSFLVSETFVVCGGSQYFQLLFFYLSATLNGLK